MTGGNVLLSQAQLPLSLQLSSSGQKNSNSLMFFWFLLRSPWSNTYDPPLDDGAVPSDRLRKLEIDANTAFDQYREM